MALSTEAFVGRYTTNRKTIMTKDILAVILDSNGPEFEEIQEAESEGQAIGIAIEFLKNKNVVADKAIVKQVVSKIRELR